MGRSATQGLSKQREDMEGFETFRKVELRLKVPVFAKLSPKQEQDWLRQQRARLGLSQPALARALGVCRWTITSWETGRQRVPKRHWWKLRRLLGEPGVAR